MALSDVQIRNASSDGKRVRLFDGGGLYLEVSPQGGKWWRFKYRLEGKEKLLSLGVYPAVPLAGRWIDKAKQKAKDATGYLKGARDRRDEARALVASGVDPSLVRKAERRAAQTKANDTFKVVALAWLEHRAKAWKPGTLDAIRASLETHVFPKLGGHSIKEIQAGDIRGVIKAIEARGASETAGRVFQRLRAIYRFAIAHDLATEDPTYPLKPSEILAPRKVVHRPALAEKDAPLFLRKLATYEGDPATKAALELLILTAVRPGELRGARWAEFDEEKRLWRIAGERMKMQTPHVVPLSEQALVVLKNQRTKCHLDDLVFPSPFYPGKPLSDGTLNSALARLGYKGIATAHGFRTLFSTCANEAGWNGDLIEKQLAHEERDEVRGAYNRAQYLSERARLMDWWGERIDHMRKRGRVRI